MKQQRAERPQNIRCNPPVQNTCYACLENVGSEPCKYALDFLTLAGPCKYFKRDLDYGKFND